MVKNANPKQLRYLELVKQLRGKYKQVMFVNLSISALGLFEKTSFDFTNMKKDQHIDNVQTSFVIWKIIDEAIWSVSKKIRQYLEQIGIDIRIGLLQNTDLLGTARILRNELETWEKNYTKDLWP